jgi:hypothetical protein
VCVFEYFVLELENARTKYNKYTRITNVAEINAKRTLCDEFVWHGFVWSIFACEKECHSSNNCLLLFVHVCLCTKRNRIEGNMWNFIAIVGIEIFMPIIDLIVL